MQVEIGEKRRQGEIDEHIPNIIVQASETSRTNRSIDFSRDRILYLFTLPYRHRDMPDRALQVSAEKSMFIHWYKHNAD